MKKVTFLILMVAIALGSCNNPGEGYLIGVQGRGDFYQPDPFGMLFIPIGSYTMGPSDQDVPYSQTAQSKTVSVQAFWMDETEITNNEYRQFVHYVRDSIVRLILSNDNEEFLITQNEYEEDYDPPLINWRTRIRWNNPEVRQALEEEIYLPQHERFYRYREIDARKLNFEYYWIDLKEAAKKDFDRSKRKPDAASLANRPQGLSDRSVYIRKDVINVYPDTLAWVHDFTYSFNEPMTENYFWHPTYDHYPVVGVNWKQATAFCIWRTNILHDYFHSIGEPYVHRFRLPTESEWEWAARGGLDLNPYPWGGPYIRNSNGCFNGNYKPMRGNYVDDGGFHTIIVAHWAPNDYGLYDMGGNVAEWTSNAFDESAYNFAHDLNMDYSYDAKDEDAPVLKRKVIRGGSWKDIGYYMQTGSRTFEYQDSCRSFVGFRCVQTYMGRMKGDGASASNVY